MSYKLHPVKAESYSELEKTALDYKDYPSFSLDESDLPEIKGWQVGKKYMLEIEVEMVSSSKNEYGKSKLSSRFNIHKIGCEEMDEDEMMAKKGHR